MAVINESFDKADGPGLGPDLTWSLLAGTWSTSANQATITAAGLPESLARAETDLGSADHYVEVVINDFGTSSYCDLGLSLRMSSDGLTRYVVKRLRNASGAGYDIRKYIGGTLTNLRSATLLAQTFPETLRAEVEGNEIRFYVNDVLIDSVTDSDIATGNFAGLDAFRNSTASTRRVLAASFEAGDLGAPPAGTTGTANITLGASATARKVASVAGSASLILSAAAGSGGTLPEQDDPTVALFHGTTLPDGWTAVQPATTTVEMAGDFLRLATPAGGNFDSLGNAVTAPQGPLVWRPVSGSFDYAVGLAEEPQNLPFQGLDLLALTAAMDGVRCCAYCGDQTGTFRADHNYYVYSRGSGSQAVAGNTSALYGAAGWLRLAYDQSTSTITYSQSRTGLPGSWVQISQFVTTVSPARFALHAIGYDTADVTNGREQRIDRVVDMLARGTDSAVSAAPSISARSVIQSATDFTAGLPAWLTADTANGGVVTANASGLTLQTTNAQVGSHAWVLGPNDLTEDHGVLLRYQVGAGYTNAFWTPAIGASMSTDIPGARTPDDKFGPGVSMIMEMPGRQHSTAGTVVRMLRRSPVRTAETMTGSREFDGYSMLIEDLAFPVGTVGGPVTWMRFEKAGQRFRVRIWLDGETEPTEWHQELQDHARRGTAMALTLGHNDASTGSATATVTFTHVEVYTPVSSLTVNLTGDTNVEAGDTVHLAAVASGGTVSSWTWEADHPDVVLTGSGASREFIAPASMDGLVVNITATATPPAGDPVSDTLNVVVARHMRWSPQTGVWVPIWAELLEV